MTSETSSVVGIMLSSTETDSLCLNFGIVSKQIEFYFSDVNLPKDKFLLTKISESPEGWVPISVIISFSRIKSLLKGIQGEKEKENFISVALASSSLIEVNNETSALRRKIPLQLGSRDDLKATLYVKGFPNTENITLESLTSFFQTLSDSQFAVRMRRLLNEEKSFKGSVYVEFLSELDVDKILDKTPVPTFIDDQGNEHALIFMKKFDHIIKKRPHQVTSKTDEVVNDKDSLVKISPIPKEVDWRAVQAELVNHQVPVVSTIIDFDDQIAYAILKKNEALKENCGTDLTNQKAAVTLSIATCPSFTLENTTCFLSLPTEDEVAKALTLFSNLFSNRPRKNTKRKGFSKQSKGQNSKILKREN